MEDEFVRAIAVLSNDGSPDGMEVLETVIRSLENDMGKMKAFMLSPKMAVVDGRETGTFQINHARFNQSISLIVRALWFKAHEEKLLADLDVQWVKLRTSNLDTHPEMTKLERIANHWPASDYKGFYPEVFRYDFHEYPPSREGEISWVCRLCFYDDAPVLVTWKV